MLGINFDATILFSELVVGIIEQLRANEKPELSALMQVFINSFLPLWGNFHNVNNSSFIKLKKINKQRQPRYVGFLFRQTA